LFQSSLWVDSVLNYGQASTATCWSNLPTLITLSTLHVPLVSLWCVYLVRSVGEVWSRGLDTMSLDCHCIIKVLKTVFLVLLMNYSGSHRNEILPKVVFYWFSPSHRFLTKLSFCHFWLFLSVFSLSSLRLVDLSVVSSSVLCMIECCGVTLVTILSLGIPLMPTSCGVSSSSLLRSFEVVDSSFRRFRVFVVSSRRRRGVLVTSSSCILLVSAWQTVYPMSTVYSTLPSVSDAYLVWSPRDVQLRRMDTNSCFRVWCLFDVLLCDVSPNRM
jgi:hypothetical protein